MVLGMSTNGKSPLQSISPPWGSEQPLKYTPNHTAVAASCCLPPAALCHRGRAGTSLPFSLALTDPQFSCHHRNSCRTQALKLNRSSLPLVGFPVHLKSLQSDGPSGRQSLPVAHVCAKVCRAVAFKDIGAIDMVTTMPRFSKSWNRGIHPE